MLALAVALRLIRAPEIGVRYDRHLHITIIACIALLAVLAVITARMLMTPLYGCASTRADALTEQNDLAAFRAALRALPEFRNFHPLRVNGRQLVVVDGLLPQSHARYWDNGPGLQLLQLWTAIYRKNHPSERGPVNVVLVYPDGEYLTAIAPHDCISL